jgi:hypothetical protein
LSAAELLFDKEYTWKETPSSKLVVDACDDGMTKLSSSAASVQLLSPSKIFWEEPNVVAPIFCLSGVSMNMSSDTLLSGGSKVAGEAACCFLLEIKRIFVKQAIEQYITLQCNFDVLTAVRIPIPIMSCHKNFFQSGGNAPIL